MKILTTLVSAVLVMSAVHPAFAQQRGTCGVIDPMPLLERVTAHQKVLAEGSASARSLIVKYVPVTFHLVADDNGNGRAREEQVLDQLDRLNEYYADQEMIFYLDELRYKDHSLIFTQPSHPTSVFQMKLIKDPNAMNIYVCQTADNGSGNPGITLGFYSSPNDWIVIRKDEVSSFNNTLAHEIGHFFSLPHPHSGWECEPWDEDLHGNPVSSIWSPCNGSLQVEYMNGSNWQISGDRIADTNPDYNFGFGWSVGGDQCAEFTIDVMDPNGDVIDVVENNHMGYFIGCDDYIFTSNQKTIIQSDFFSGPRAYLRTGYIPTLEPVDNNVTYIYPINGEETGTSGIVDLDWDDVPNATDYLVIVDRSASFAFIPRRFIVQESFLTVDGLMPNVNYFWKLWPYNESQTGAGWAATQMFHTGEVSAVETIPSVNALEVFPNPVASGQEVLLTIETSAPFTAEIVLYGLTGEVISRTGEEFIASGKTVRIPVDTRNAMPGLYILKVQSSEGGVISRKVSLF